MKRFFRNGSGFPAPLRSRPRSRGSDMRTGRLLLLIGCALCSGPGAAQEVNLYSARKEILIRPLLDRFTEQSGIEVRLLAGQGDALLKRLELEGANTPADLYLTVDLGRLYQAAQRGLLQAVDSPLLRERIPPAYRDPEGRWYGITLRARAIVYSRERVPAAELPGYLGLADRRWQGRLCVRSSANTYNQSLVAALIARYGAAEAERWARGLVANFARPPQGGDRDQIRAVYAELCDVALANTYYLGLMRHSGKERDAAAAQAMGVHWPAPGGVHVNLSGAGVVRHARHVPEALQLLEFLVRAQAQRWFTEVNYEYPVVSDVAPSPALREWGEFAPDVDSLLLLGEHVQEAAKLMDRAGWR